MYFLHRRSRYSNSVPSWNNKKYHHFFIGYEHKKKEIQPNLLFLDGSIEPILLPYPIERRLRRSRFLRRFLGGGFLRRCFRCCLHSRFRCFFYRFGFFTFLRSTQKLLARLKPKFGIFPFRPTGLLPNIVSSNSNVFFIDFCHKNTPLFIQYEYNINRSLCICNSFFQKNDVI